MRICLVTVQDPFRSLTGVAVYVRSLGDMLTRLGHEVSHFWMTGYADIRHLMTDVVGKAPDVVHIHDTHGLEPSFIEITQSSGLPVVVTLHDFWAFCRQLLLVRQNLQPCGGTDAGRNCALYCASPKPSGKVHRVLEFLPGGHDSPLAGSLRAAATMYRFLRGSKSSQFVVQAVSPASGHDVPELIRQFSNRETAFRAILLKADVLLTVSDSAKRLFVAHGYPADRIKVINLSTSGLEQIRHRLHRFRGYPIRFGYLGQVGSYKGVHILAKAVRGIPSEQVQVHLFGPVRPEDRRYLRMLSGGHRVLIFHGAFRQDDLPKILDELDMVVFPSIQQETIGIVGLEAQAAGLPVIASRIGAIPEYIHHEVNGLLFEPGNATDLRRQIERVLANPGLIETFSPRTNHPKSMAEHTAEILQIYERFRKPTPATA